MQNLKKYQIQDESLEEDENESSKEDIIEPTKPMLAKEPHTHSRSIIKCLLSNKLLVPEAEGEWEDHSIINNTFSNNAMNPTQNLNNQDIFVTNISHIELNENSDKGKTKDFHHMQIIDEDVENFKRRLDIMIKNFRTDTLKDFMGIKRHLLVEQKSIIDSERQKCEALLAAKTDQIEHLKENLSKAKIAVNNETEVKERMGNYLLKIKSSKYLKNLKTKVFIAGIKKYYLKKKKNSKILEKIRKKIIYKNKQKIINMLKTNFKEMKTVKTIQYKEKEFQDKLNEMSQYYGKEINDLRSKLHEANSAIDKHKISKDALQDNLKKALMRGVVAMNLEAMNVLEGEGVNNSNLKIMENLMGNLNLSNTSTNSNFANKNNLQHESNNRDQHKIEDNPSSFNSRQIQMQTPIIAGVENFEKTKNIVVKDSNWVNACAVPTKMKTNIISNEDDQENEFEESFKVKSKDNNNNKSNYNKTSNQILKNNSSYLPPASVHDLLTKNLNSIKSEFQNVKKYTGYDNNPGAYQYNQNDEDANNSLDYNEDDQYLFNKNYNNVVYGKMNLGDSNRDRNGVGIYPSKNLLYKKDDDDGDERENVFANNLNNIHNRNGHLAASFKKSQQAVTDLNNSNKNSMSNFNQVYSSCNTGQNNPSTNKTKFSNNEIKEKTKKSLATGNNNSNILTSNPCKKNSNALK